MLTCERSSENTSDTIWDRSTLYGFKCAFLSGKGDEMLEHLLRYCKKRLLCDRVPYAVEAYPEGAKRHLSGESALFVRIVTEGIFGLQSEGLDSFSFVASCPRSLGKIRLEKIFIAGKCFDIEIDSESWRVFKDGSVIKTGTTDGKRVTVS
jgi:hypothetical protein